MYLAAVKRAARVVCIWRLGLEAPPPAAPLCFDPFKKLQPISNEHDSSYNSLTPLLEFVCIHALVAVLSAHLDGGECYPMKTI